MVQEAELLLGCTWERAVLRTGVLVYSNNGETGQAALEHFDIEAGALYEWNGKDWKLVRRNQFVEVTGPGGILAMPIRQPTPSGLPAGTINRFWLGVRNAETGWIFTACQKQVTVTTALTAGIPNGQESAILEPKEIPIT